MAERTNADGTEGEGKGERHKAPPLNRIFTIYTDNRWAERAWHQQPGRNLSNIFTVCVCVSVCVQLSTWQATDEIFENSNSLI